MEEHEKPWEPYAPEDVARLFAGADFHWWLAGGFALELFAGRSWRMHSDIDVLLLREEHLRARRWLRAYQCWAADPPGRLRSWNMSESLPPHVHDIWCRESDGAPWRFQLMIDESEGEDWVSRRDPRIRRSIASIELTAQGIPILAPEVQLYYKARAPRAKDDADFAAVLPLLSARQRAWLGRAISLVHDDNHPWHAALT